MKKLLFILLLFISSYVSAQIIRCSPAYNKIAAEEGESLGEEMITNGSFVDVMNPWFENAGFSVDAGADELVLTDVAAYGYTGQNIGHEIGVTYKVVYTIVSISEGKIRPQFEGGGTGTGTYQTAPGTYTEYLVPTGEGNLYFDVGNLETSGRMDNVSVKEVL